MWVLLLELRGEGEVGGEGVVGEVDGGRERDLCGETEVFGFGELFKEIEFHRFTACCG